VRPLAIVLTLPLTVVTFGLFLLVLNGVMLKLAATLVPGFRIRGFMPAVWGSLLLTLLNLLIDAFMGPEW
jgi:putative membrane protein